MNGWAGLLETVDQPTSYKNTENIRNIENDDGIDTDEYL